MKVPVRPDRGGQGARYLVLQPDIIGPLAAAPGITAVNLPGEFAQVPLQAQPQRAHVVLHLRDRIQQVVAHHHRLADAADNAERVGRVGRVDIRKELPVSAIELLITVREMKLVAGADRPQQSAEVEIQQSVTVRLDAPAVRYQVLLAPVAVIPVAFFRHPFSIPVAKLAPGKAGPGKVGAGVAHQRGRRTEPVHVHETEYRTEATAARGRKNRRMDSSVGQRAFIAETVLLFVPPHRPQAREFDRGVDITAIPGLAEQSAHGAVIELILVVTFENKVIEAFSGDDVHHPGDGIGAVDGRGAVLEDLDPVNGGIRDRVQVDAVDLTAGACRRKAAAVHQDQGAARIQAAQAERVDAGTAGDHEPPERVVDLCARGQGAGLQDLRGVGHARQGSALAGDDRYRQGRCECIAPDA